MVKLSSARALTVLVWCEEDCFFAHSNQEPTVIQPGRVFLILLVFLVLMSECASRSWSLSHTKVGLMDGVGVKSEELFVERRACFEKAIFPGLGTVSKGRFRRAG